MARRYWYIKVAANTSPILAGSYTRVTVPFGGCTPAGCLICAVNALGGNVTPLQSQFNVGTNIYDYISNALTSCTHQPVGSKIFVYTILAI